MNGNRVGVGLRERLYVSTTATFDPDNDLDFIAIEYALNGEPVKLTTAEKIYAARLLDERAMDFKNIGRRVGLTRPRSVGGRPTGGSRAVHIRRRSSRPVRSRCVVSADVSPAPEEG
ncbi:hypothetical protein D3C59_35895 [Streptomyces sp. SHP22-7]|nr:hypothetical protein D3C59_35895 [Streptomyces sp. SHP22-7]